MQASSRAHLHLLAGAVIVLGGVALLVGLAHHADASHFRGGTMYAVPDTSPGAPPNTVHFEGRLFFRASYAYFPACSPGTLYTGVLGPTSSSMFGGGPGTIHTNGATITHAVRFIACNPTDDWLVAKIVDPTTGDDGVSYTYPTALNGTAPWTAYWEAHARLSAASPNQHLNNADRSYRLETSVDLSGSPDDPPRPFVPPIVQCPTAGACSIPVPYADSDPDTHTLRFSTSPEAIADWFWATETFRQPGDPACGACGTAAPSTVTTTPFEFHWDTTGATVAASPDRTYYSTQLMVEDGREKVPMDFLIRLVDGTPPVWDVPPSPCDQSVTLIQGNTLTQAVQASSPMAGRTVTMIPLDLPGSASFAGGAAGNPSTGTLTWSTSVSTRLGDYLAVFFAQDDLGLTAPTCVMHIKVVPPPAPDFTHVFTTTAPADLTLDPVQFTDTTTYAPYFAGATRSWTWTFSDPTDPSGAYTMSPMHTYGDDGTFPACMTLTVTTGGAPWSGTVCHDVVPHNRAPVPNPTATASGTQLTFADGGGDQDGTVVGRVWDFGDGTTASGLRVTHEFQADGVYDVCLTDTDDDGAQGTTCLQVRIARPEAKTDFDLDGVTDEADNCPELANRDQADQDRDGVGDACDEAPTDPKAGGPSVQPAATPGDADRDGIADATDVCPHRADADQADRDHDGVGDACDPDGDGDQVLDGTAGIAAGAIVDNCPLVANPDQTDTDGDGIGDACAGVTGAAQSPAARPGAADAQLAQGTGTAWIGLAVAFVGAAAVAGLVAFAVLRRNA